MPSLSVTSKASSPIFVLKSVVSFISFLNSSFKLNVSFVLFLSFSVIDSTVNPNSLASPPISLYISLALTLISKFLTSCSPIRPSSCFIFARLTSF